jgi:hypothetical protein
MNRWFMHTTLMIRWLSIGLRIFGIEVYIVGYGFVCAHRVAKFMFKRPDSSTFQEYAKTLCGSLQAHSSILEYKG